MMTRSVVNIQINVITSFHVNRGGEKCSSTGSVRLEGGAGKKARDNKEIVCKI